MRNKKLKKMLCMSTLIASICTTPIYAANESDTVNLDNQVPAQSQETEINVGITSSATVTIPKKINFSINDSNSEAVLTEDGNYEYYVNVTVDGSITSAESVFVSLDDSEILFVNKSNPNITFKGRMFYHEKDDTSSYVFENTEASWEQDVVNGDDESSKTKQMVIVVPAEYTTVGGDYTATVNFNINKGVESTSVSSWSSIYDYVAVGNGEAVITGYKDNADIDVSCLPEGITEVNELTDIVIPKKIKNAAGYMVKVAGIEAGAFADNTNLNSVKIMGDCAVGVIIRDKDGNNNPSDNAEEYGLKSLGSKSVAGYTSPYSYTITSEGNVSYKWRYIANPYSGTTNNFKGAFEGCTNLKKVYLSNVTAISQQAFMNCEKLAYINFPDTLKEVGPKAFIGCPNLTVNYNADNTIIYTGELATAYNANYNYCYINRNIDGNTYIDNNIYNTIDISKNINSSWLNNRIFEIGVQKISNQ